MVLIKKDHNQVDPGKAKVDNSAKTKTIALSKQRKMGVLKQSGQRIPRMVFAVH